MLRAKELSRILVRLAVVTVAGTAPAPAQTVADSPGVTVSAPGSTLLHRTGVPYPNAAKQKGVRGTLVLETTLDASGEVIDARVLSGPAELRRTSLESVLEWHFTPDAANSTRQVILEFDLPEQAARPQRGPDFNPALVVLLPAPAGPIGRRIHNIEIQGIPEAARNDLMARLPAREGDVLSQELAEALTRAAHDFDEHLRVGFGGAPNGEASVQILLPPYSLNSTPPVPSAPGRIRVTQAVLQAKLKSAPAPEYPAAARQARIQGVVKLDAVVGKDGTVQNLAVISGHPLLVPAAIEAVKHWTYDSILINGAPTEIQSEVDVTFALPQE